METNETKKGVMKACVSLYEHERVQLVEIGREQANKAKVST